MPVISANIEVNTIVDVAMQLQDTSSHTWEQSLHAVTLLAWYRIDSSHVLLYLLLFYPDIAISNVFIGQIQDSRKNRDLTRTRGSSRGGSRPACTSPSPSPEASRCCKAAITPKRICKPQTLFSIWSYDLLEGFFKRVIPSHLKYRRSWRLQCSGEC